MSDPEAPTVPDPAVTESISNNATSKPDGAQEAADTIDPSTQLNGEAAGDREGGAPAESELKDTHMTDASPSDQPQSSVAPAASATASASTSATAAQNTSNAPSPTPVPIPPPRVNTPSRNLNTSTNNPTNGTTSSAAVEAGENQRTSSRAASVNPDAGPSFMMPSEAPVHGAPVRQYINSKITTVLLEGMKMVAKEQPRDPLRVLGEFLLQKSREIEGTTTTTS